MDDFSPQVCKPTRVGMSHSYTVKETKTSSFLQTYILKCQISGEELKDRTKPDWYYCIIEDGTVFKFHPKERVFYQLDLDKLVWRSNQSLVSLYYDTFLKFQEFDGFVDYYPHADEHK